MTTHTPGPWHVQPSDHPGGLLIKPIPGQVIAQCDAGPNMVADARLMAAAPDLLDAGRDALEQLEQLESMHSDDAEFMAALTSLRAAIAKAEGNQ